MSKAEWSRITLPVELPEGEAFVRGACRVFVSRDGPQRRWHLSISCERRYPSWDEIKKARYDLCPEDITMAMLLPPTDEYINIHENCFHLHELVESSLILMGIR